MLFECVSFVIKVFGAAELLLIVLCAIGLPVTILFVCHRIAQVRDPRPDLRPTAPTHTILNLFCTGVYGILAPAYLLLAVNLDAGRVRFEMLEFGKLAEAWWIAAPLALGLSWMTAHRLEAVLRRGAPVFHNSWPNWVVGVMAATAYWWLIITVELTVYYQIVGRGYGGGGLAGQLKVFLEQSFVLAAFGGPFFGALAVYALAAYESRYARRPPPRRRWKPAIAVTLAIFLPVAIVSLIRLPHRSHKQALATLEQHHELIVGVARDAELDPALLAELVYAAQTQERQRWFTEEWENLRYSFTSNNLSVRNHRPSVKADRRSG